MNGNEMRQARERAGLTQGELGEQVGVSGRTVATAIYSADGLDNASQQLGHSEVSVTAKHYVQRLNIGPSGVVGVLDGWLQSAS